MLTITKEEVVKNGFPHIPMLIDTLREFGETLELPEIRVWCHGKDGDSFKPFPTFDAACKYIQSRAGKRAGCDSAPLLAFRGFEFKLWEVPQLKTPVREDPPPCSFRDKNY